MLCGGGADFLLPPKSRRTSSVCYRTQLTLGQQHSRVPNVRTFGLVYCVQLCWCRISTAMKLVLLAITVVGLVGLAGLPQPSFLQSIPVGQVTRPSHTRSINLGSQRKLLQEGVHREPQFPGDRYPSLVGQRLVGAVLEEGARVLRGHRGARQQGHQQHLGTGTGRIGR